MDEVLKSEVVLVVLEKEDGVLFNEFAGLFHMVHGYPLTLSNYGYKSLKALLNDMSDVVELKDVDGQQLIKYRSPSVKVIALQENEPDVLETCTVSCEPQSEQRSSRTNLIKPLSSQVHFSSTIGNYTKHKGLCKRTKPSKKVEKIIFKTIFSHPSGVGAERMRATIMTNHSIDLDLYSRELGYTDMLNMLKQMPEITFVPYSKKNVLKVSSSHEKPKSKPQVEFSEKNINSVLKQFPLGIRLERLKEKIHEAHHIDLDEWSHQMGYTDMLSMLKQKSGIIFLNKNVVIASDISAKCKTQPENLNNVPFSINLISTFLKSFSSGLTIKKLRRHFKNKHNMDLDKYSCEMGYTDIISMLQQIAGLTVVNSNLVTASDVRSSINLGSVTKSTADQDLFSNSRQKNSKQSPSPRLQPSATASPAPNLNDTKKMATETINTDLFTSSRQANKCKSAANFGVSHHIKKFNKAKESGPSARSSVSKAAKPAAHPVLSNRKKIAIGDQTCAATTAKIPSSSFTSSIPKTIPSNDVANTVKVTPSKTVQSNLSYAAVCTNNLRRGSSNHNVQHCAASFNVQEIQTSKVSNPSTNAESKGALPSSMIKENLYILLKYYSKGLSIFQLQKLYLMKFNQPLAYKGVSVKKLIKVMEDVAKIKGIGVQLLVFPVPSEQYPSINTNLLNGGGSNKEDRKNISVSLSKHQPLTDGRSQTKLGKELILDSLNSNHNHTRLSNQDPTCDQNENLNGSNYLNSNDKLTAVCYQFKQIDSLSYHVASAKNESDNEWPSLPQKYNILKEVKRSLVTAHQQDERGQDNKFFFKKGECETLQPQEHNDSALTIHFLISQNVHKLNNKNDHGQQESQASNIAHPISHSDFLPVMGHTGLSFVKGELNADMNKNLSEVDGTSLSSKKLNISAQNASGHSKRDLRSCITPTNNLLSLSAVVNAQSKNQCPHAEKKHLESQTNRELPFLMPEMQQNMPVNYFLNDYGLPSPGKMEVCQDLLNPSHIVSSALLGISLAQNDQQDSPKESSEEEDAKTWQKDYYQSCRIL